MSRPNPTTELLAAMAKYGLDPGTIEWDGEIHRFPGAGKGGRNDAGWYIAFSDRFGAVFGDYSQGLDGDNGVHWKLHNGKRPDGMDKAEWQKMKEEMAVAAADRELEQKLEWDEVSQECTERFRDADDATPDLPYLVSKGIEEHLEGTKKEGNNFLIPMKALDVTDGESVQNIQTIYPNGKKRFAKGARTKGTRTTIGASAFKDEGVMYICEGWATGWAIHHVTGSAVVVTFQAGNLKEVAVHYRQKHKKAEIIVCADNDRWTKTTRGGKKVPNPGLVFAAEAAKAANAKLAVPDFASYDDEPTDFHDLWQREGEEAVRNWLDPNEAANATTHAPGDLKRAEREPSTSTESGTEAVPEEEEAGAEGDGENDLSWHEAAPFRCLGHNRGTYFYLPRATGQIIGLSPTQHDRKTLLPLAPLAWWEHHFAAPNGVKWTPAADALMRASEKAGVFQPENLRGRGCWPDENGIILHLGDRLLPPEEKKYVDPEEYTCSEGLIYERLPRLAGPSKDRVLELKEAKQLLSLFRTLLWRDEASGPLLAGWVTLAPLCGALGWRPHVQLVGESGSGKTTVLKELVRPLLGGMVCHVEGGTSEAGIRQRLRADALPVVYDEAEKTDARSDAMVQKVIGLARSASSTGSEVLKGTTHGEALSFQIRSMFCLASIGGAARQEADKSRISLLVLRGRSQVSGDERREHWESFGPRLKAVDEKMGRELVARTLAWLRDGRLDRTLKVMRGAASSVLDDARAGDQYGTLYAGAWTLMSDEPPDPLEARELLEADDLGAYQESAKPEALKCLGVLLQQRERVDTSNGLKMLSIGQLVDACCGSVGPVSAEEARSHLKPLGLMVEVKDGGYDLLIANNSEWISAALRDTPYVGDHRNILRQLDGVTAGPTNVRFTSGLRERVTVVPIGVIDPE